MDINRDIDSLTSFKRSTPTFIKRLKKTGHPLVLTVNGKAEVVVQSAAAYQHLMDLVEQAAAIVGIRRGLESMRQGESLEAGVALAGLRKKHDIRKDA